MPDRGGIGASVLQDVGKFGRDFDRDGSGADGAGGGQDPVPCLLFKSRHSRTPPAGPNLKKTGRNQLLNYVKMLDRGSGFQ